MTFPAVRMRRNRRTAWSRRLVAENSVSSADLILPIIIVAIAAAGFAGYRYLNQPAQQADDFRAVLNLTPGNLLMNCGQPAFTSVGVVGDSAGAGHALQAIRSG